LLKTILEGLLSVEFIYCGCGCGLTTSKYQIEKDKIRKDRPKEYIRGHHFRINKYIFEGENHYLWKDGKHYDRAGYILILKKDHPYSSSTGHIPEHRLVMEQYIGRYLTKEEVVHHINGIKDDNRISNLQLMNNKEHSLLHLNFRKIKEHNKNEE
jgi:HNH endonuclease